jgi:hypothetical protein
MAGVLTGLYLKLLETGEYSDFAISCKDVEFKVHRAVVCTASSMLKAACNGPFEVLASPDAEIQAKFL